MPYRPYFMADVRKAEKQGLFSVVSLFAGCGGSSTGYRLAGGKVLLANEFIPAAIETYKANYPDTVVLPDDVRQLTGQKILSATGLKSGELDVLDGSPPCASFSMSGKREKAWGKVKKYSDTTQRVDDLFFEFARLLRELQPRAFVAENVKGLTVGVAKNLLGTTFPSFFPDEEGNILRALQSCGYRVKCKVLNAADYGVPQERLRLIFVGVRKDLGALPSHPPRTQEEYLTVREAFEDLGRQDLRGTEVAKHTLTGQLHLKCRPGQSISDIHPKRHFFNFGRLHYDRPSSTLIACGQRYYLHPEADRTLTVGEWKRLMSFPDDFVLTGTPKQQFERLGRSVPPLMMRAVASHVYREVLSKCAG